MLIQPKYHAAGPFLEGLARVKVGNQWGFINTQGNIIIPAEFDRVSDFHDGLVWVKKESEFYFYHRNGKVAFRITTKTPGEMGMGAILQWPMIEKVHNFSEGFAVVENKYSLIQRPSNTPKVYGFINTNGEYVAYPLLRGAKDFCEGLAAVLVREKSWGFIDKNSFGSDPSKLELIIGPVYEEVKNFSEGLAAVQQGGYWGFINKRAKMVIQPKFIKVRSFSEGLAAVCLGGKKWGFIDPTGKLVFKCHWNYLIGNDFSDGLVIMNEHYRSPDGKWWNDFTVFNKNGKILYEFEKQFKNMYDFKEGVARAIVKPRNYVNDWLLINKRGVRIRQEYFIDGPSDGRLRFRRKVNNVLKWGYLNTEGKVVIQPRYDMAEDFSQGLAPVGIYQ